LACSASNSPVRASPAGSRSIARAHHAAADAGALAAAADAASTRIVIASASPGRRRRRHVGCQVGEHDVASRPTRIHQPRRDRGVNAPPLGRAEIVVQRVPHDRMRELEAAAGAPQEMGIHQGVEGDLDCGLIETRELFEEIQIVEIETPERR
jgi:hypothetical protein